MSKKSVLVLCTGNSCRSQMAHGFLKAFDPELEVVSAGTEPAKAVHPMAIEVMKEYNIDISAHQPRSVEMYLDRSFDHVITVCGGAKESCPMSTGEVRKRVHIGFEDPADATGTAAEIHAEFERIRDEILVGFYAYYRNEIR
ncbi:MAG: arsenate reductase ArsC [Flavobacteriales bacterium]